MSFRSFKKETKKRMEEGRRIREENQVIDSLGDAIRTMEKRRDEYAEQAKEELKRGNKGQYNAMIALLKNVMFNISQTRDMLTNYRMAIDLRDMQQLNKKFVTSIDSIMKNVYKTCKDLNVAASQELFKKALIKQSYTASELQQLLKENNMNFAVSVNSLSDISDDEIKSLLEAEIRKDDRDIDETLAKLEKEFVNKTETEKTTVNLVDGTAPHAATENDGKSMNSINISPANVPTETGVKPKNEQTSDMDGSYDSEFTYKGGNYIFPTADLLDEKDFSEIRLRNKEDMQNSIDIVEKKFADFGISVKAENLITGALFSRIELRLNDKTPLSQIERLDKDISMALQRNVKLLLPIPGKDLIGVEVENSQHEYISLRTLLNAYPPKDDKIMLGFGFDIESKPFFTSISSLPHLLIGGCTGSGKSTFVNDLIIELLYNYTPEEVRLVLMDFKRVEFLMYNGLPHLYGGKIIDECDEALRIFDKLVAEMERRYELFSRAKVRNITEYNEKNPLHKLPVIVTVIDEYADLINYNEKQTNLFIQKLSQKARACGIHLVVATQRPSVKVVNGIIKSNFSARVAFHVTSHTDSMTILDLPGAEDLYSGGDMMLSMAGKILNLQAPFISTSDVEKVTEFIRDNNK